jgi:hypothetical protein
MVENNDYAPIDAAYPCTSDGSWVDEETVVIFHRLEAAPSII